MTTESRYGEIPLGGEAHMWAAQSSVEATALQRAEHDGAVTHVSVLALYEGGSFYADSIAAARARLQDRRLAPTSIDLTVLRDSDMWVSAKCRNRFRELTLWVYGDDEVAMHGVYTILENAVRAVPEPEPAPLPVATAVTRAQPSRWGRILNHGWTVAIGSGLVIAAVLAAVTHLF